MYFLCDEISVQMKRYLFTAIFILGCVLCQKSTYLIEEFIGNMLNSIVRDHMTGSSCIVVVTQKNSGEIIRYLQDHHSVYHLLEIEENVGNTEIIGFNKDTTRSIWSSNFSFRQMILHTLDIGCSAYIFQTTRPKDMIRIVGDLLRRSIQRMNRKYVFLPPARLFTRGTCLGSDVGLGIHIPIDEYANENEIFSMKEANFLSNLLFLRSACNGHSIPSSCYCSKNLDQNNNCCGNMQLQPLQIYDNNFKSTVTENVFNIKNDSPVGATKKDTLANSGLNLEIKVYNDLFGKEFTVTSEPDCSQMQEGFVVEAITHKFSYPDPSVTQVLARWSVADVVQRVGDLFPDKLADLGGRPLIIVAFNYLPFTILDFQDQKDVDDGTEFRLLRELSHKLNMTWKKELDPENLWGVTQEDGTGNGVVGLVSEDRAEFGFTGMYLIYNDYPYVDFTYPHVKSAVTCLVPKPQLLGTWKVPVLPFNGWSWLAVGGSLVVTVIALRLVTKAADAYLGVATRHIFTTYTDCAMRTVGLLVLQMPTEDPRNVPMKHLLLWLGFTFMLIASSYNAGLSSVLTLPRYEPPVDTVPDLARSGTQWVANHLAWITYIEHTVDPDVETVRNHFKVYNDRVLDEMSAEHRVAFGIERLFAGHFALSKYINPEFVGEYRLMKDDLYSSYCTTYFRKGSPFTEKMNELVHSLQSSGLWYYWEGEVTRRFMSHKVQLTIATSPLRKKEGPKKLHLQHIEGALALLVFGLALSFAVFLIEILFHGKHILQR